MNTDQLTQNSTLFTARAQGCLIGLAAGDALGDAGRSNLYRNRYGIVTDLYDGLKGTDDTEFAILTARALIDGQGSLTPQVVLDVWRKYILERGGILERAGKPLYGAVENLRRGILPPLSGRDNVMNDDDGAAMRAAPIGIVCAGQPQRAAELAAIDAQVSHADDGILAAQAVAASVAVAMLGASVEEVFEAGMQQIPADSWLGRAMQRCQAICRASDGIEEAWESLHHQFWTPAHAASPEAIPQVYGVFLLTGGDFRKGLFWAANFGRDADTIAAIVGALNGARHGIEAIPQHWVERLRRPGGVSLRFTAEEDLLELANSLAQLAMQSIIK
jgi:ADP-ribosylglycohydrolase